MERGRPRPRPDGLGKETRRKISKEPYAGNSFAPPSTGRRGRRPPYARANSGAASDAESHMGRGRPRPRPDGQGKETRRKIPKEPTAENSFAPPSPGRRGRRPPICSRQFEGGIRCGISYEAGSSSPVPKPLASLRDALVWRKTHFPGVSLRSTPGYIPGSLRLPHAARNSTPPTFPPTPDTPIPRAGRHRGSRNRLRRFA